MQLLKALRIVSRLESSRVREQVFADITSRSTPIRLGAMLHRLMRRVHLSHWLVALYGLFYYIRVQLPEQTPRWLAVAVLANEHKHLDDLDNLMPEAAPARVTWSLMGSDGWLALVTALGHIGDMRRVMRVLRRVEAPLGFMPACRVAETLFLYVRFHSWLARHKVRAVLVTSDYSPDAAALAAAASALGIPRIYMPHALPSIINAWRSRLDFDLYIFDSLAMRDRFASLGNLTAPVAYRGVRGEYRAMQLERLGALRPRFGVFLSGLTDLKALADTVAALKHFKPHSIVLRGHPVALANPNFLALAKNSPEIKISHGTPLLQDAEACDLVIAGNTTAFLEVLKYGVPAVYLAALDRQPYDYNGFVRDGLVPVISAAEKLNLENIKTFFAPPWPKRLAYFDAAYGEDIEHLSEQVRQAILSVIG